MAPIFDFSFSKERSLTDKQTNSSNQIILMSRSLDPQDLMPNRSFSDGNSIKKKGVSIASKSLTDQLFTQKFEVSSSCEKRANIQQTIPANVKTDNLDFLRNLSTSGTASPIIIPKRIKSNKFKNSKNNEMDIKIDSESNSDFNRKIGPNNKFFSMSSVSNEVILNSLANHKKNIVDSTTNDSEQILIKPKQNLEDMNNIKNDHGTIRVRAENLYRKKNENPAAINNDATKIEDIIENTSNLFPTFDKVKSDANPISPVNNDETNCVETELDIKNSNIFESSMQLTTKEECNVPLIRKEQPINLRNTNLDYLCDNPIMDECTAALTLVLMSLSFSPKSSYTANQTITSCSSIPSKNVVFKCIWRNDCGIVCGKESKSREQIECHVRRHLGLTNSIQNSINSSNGDHEEDFYYTEIDVLDLNTQDSLGVSFSDSVDRNSRNFYDCSEMTETNTNNHQTKQGICTKRRDLNEEINIESKLVETENTKEARDKHPRKLRRNLKTFNSKIKNTSLSWHKKNFIKFNNIFDTKRNRAIRSFESKIERQLLSEKSKHTERKIFENTHGKKQEGNLISYELLRPASSPIPIVPKSYSTSISSSAVSTSIDTISSAGSSVFSINSLTIPTSSSCSSPSLLSNFATIEDDWPNANELNGLTLIANKTPPKNNNYLEKKLIAEQTKETRLCSTFNSFVRLNTNSLLDDANKNSKGEKENTSRITQRVIHHSAETSSSQKKANKPKPQQKIIGYYAYLNRGLIEPANNHQNFYYANSNISFQSGNYTSQPSNNAKNSPKNQTIRRSRNKSGSSGKCRKKYGMENKQFWCLQCRWKKACSRVDSSNNLNNLNSENELLSISPITSAQD